MSSESSDFARIGLLRRIQAPFRAKGGNFEVRKPIEFDPDGVLQLRNGEEKQGRVADCAVKVEAMTLQIGGGRKRRALHLAAPLQLILTREIFIERCSLLTKNWSLTFGLGVSLPTFGTCSF